MSRLPYNTSINRLKGPNASDWSANIESILRVTKRNLIGCDRSIQKNSEEPSFQTGTQYYQNPSQTYQGYETDHNKKFFKQGNSNYAGPTLLGPQTPSSRAADFQISDLKNDIQILKEAIQNIQFRIEQDIEPKIINKNGEIMESSEQIKEVKQELINISQKIENVEGMQNKKLQEIQDKIGGSQQQLKDFVSKEELDSNQKQNLENIETRLEASNKAFFQEIEVIKDKTNDEINTMKDEIKKLSSINNQIEERFQLQEEQMKTFIKECISKEVDALKESIANIENLSKEEITKINDKIKEIAQDQEENKNEQATLISNIEKTQKEKISELTDQVDTSLGKLQKTCNSLVESKETIEKDYTDLKKKHQETANLIEETVEKKFAELVKTIGDGDNNKIQKLEETQETMRQDMEKYQLDLIKKDEENKALIENLSQNPNTDIKEIKKLTELETKIQDLQAELTIEKGIEKDRDAKINELEAKQVEYQKFIEEIKKNEKQESEYNELKSQYSTMEKQFAELSLQLEQMKIQLNNQEIAVKDSQKIESPEKPSSTIVQENSPSVIVKTEQKEVDINNLMTPKKDNNLEVEKIDQPINAGKVEKEDFPKETVQESPKENFIDQDSQAESINSEPKKEEDVPSSAEKKEKVNEPVVEEAKRSEEEKTDILNIEPNKLDNAQPDIDSNLGLASSLEKRVLPDSNELLSGKEKDNEAGNYSPDFGESPGPLEENDKFNEKDKDNVQINEDDNKFFEALPDANSPNRELNQEKNSPGSLTQDQFVNEEINQGIIDQTESQKIAKQNVDSAKKGEIEFLDMIGDSPEKQVEEKQESITPQPINPNQKKEQNVEPEITPGDEGFEFDKY